MDKLLRIERFLAYIELGLAGTFIIGALGISAFTILWRNLGKSTGDWVLDLPITLVTWAVFIGVGAGIASQSHVQVGVFLHMLPERSQRIILLFVYSILLGLSIFLIYYGIDTTLWYIKTDERLYEMLFTPTYITFLVIPISSILWCFHFTMRLLSLYLPLDKESGIFDL